MIQLFQTSVHCGDDAFYSVNMSRTQLWPSTRWQLSLVGAASQHPLSQAQVVQQFVSVDVMMTKKQSRVRNTANVCVEEKRQAI